MPNSNSDPFSGQSGVELAPLDHPGWMAGDFVDGQGALGLRAPQGYDTANRGAQINAFINRGYADRVVNNGAVANPSGAAQAASASQTPSQGLFEVRPASVSAGDAMNAITGLFPEYLGRGTGPVLGLLAGKLVDNDTHLTPGDVVGTIVGIGTGELGPEVSIPASFLAGKLADQYAYGMATASPPGVMRAQALQDQQPYPGYYDAGGEPWYDNH